MENAASSDLLRKIIIQQKSASLAVVEGLAAVNMSLQGGINITPALDTYYNKNELKIVKDLASVYFIADTYHAINILVVNGSADITVGTNVFENAPSGYSLSFDATTTISNFINIMGKSLGTLISITTIK